ncbi:unnamed protein product [Linum trigynum]|uniref:Uncharacterized protein n=1 Tax=Linum trigynum TaxID=586398 RepID=A0AAV2E5N6_9ROSI
MLIQSLSDPEMAADTERSLRVGSIYIISRFGLQSSRGLYRACSFDLTIKVTRSTGFQQCTLPVAGLPVDSFEVMVYRQLHTRSGNHAILTDVIGRLHSIGGISPQVTEFGPTPKQILVLENHSYVYNGAPFFQLLSFLIYA